MPSIAHDAVVICVQPIENMRLSVYDAAGRDVSHGGVQPVPGDRGVRLDLAGMPDGVYLVRVQTRDEEQVVKIVKR